MALETEGDAPPAPESSGRTARNAASLAAAEILGKVATLAWTIVAVRVLAPDRFGAFAYALAVALLLQPLPRWGFHAQFLQRASRDRDRLGTHLGRVMVWKAAIGVPVFAAAWLVISPTRPSREAAVVLGLVLLAELIDSFSEGIRLAAAALQRQGLVSAALVADRTMTAVVGVALLLSGAGVVGLAAGYLAGSVIGLVLAAWAGKRVGVRISRDGIGRRDLLATLKNSHLLGVSTVLAALVFRVDQVILEAFLGDASVAEYAVAYRLVETVLFLSWSMGKAIMPVMSADPRPETLRRGLELGTAALAAVYLPFAAVALTGGGEALQLLFGGDYGAASGSTLAWLAPAPLLFGIGYLATQAAHAVREDRRPLAANGAALVSNVVLNLALIPTLGIVAAAMTTTVTLALRTALLLRGTSVDLRAWVAALWPSAAASLGLAGTLLVLRLPILIELVVGGLVYGVLLLLVLRRWKPEHLDALARGLPLGGRIRAAVAAGHRQ